MLRVQIAVAKKSNSQSRPSSVDIYKRQVESVKQHYEDQLKEMTEELAALKQEESNFHLDIATSFAAERDAKPNVLVTERQCSINISDVSSNGWSRTAASQMTQSSCKTPSKGTGLSGLFQQADRLFSDGPAALDQSARAATSVNVTPAALRTEATSSMFKFKKSTPTLMDAAAKENRNQNKGFNLVGDHQRQQTSERTNTQAGGVGAAGAKVGRSNTPGSKGGKPSFKFVSKAASAGSKGKSGVKSSGFLPVVVMGPEEENGGEAEQMDTQGRKRSVFERDFGGWEQ